MMQKMKEQDQTKSTNIKWHNLTIDREKLEKMRGHKGMVIWFTGLSGSGKSTLANALNEVLHLDGFSTYVLDGDNIRAGINNNLTFSTTDRCENIRRIAEISKLFLNCGIITLNCFVSPSIQIRQIAKDIIGDKDFIEVYINASVATCESRDIKGLYKKARAGEIESFTGISSPFEAPNKPDLEVNTSELSIDESVQKVLDFILPIITRKK